MELQKQQWPKQQHIVVDFGSPFGAIVAKHELDQTYDHHDTYYRMHLGQIGEYHRLEHAEYELRHDQYPMIRRWFDDLSSSNENINY